MYMYSVDSVTGTDLKNSLYTYGQSKESLSSMYSTSHISWQLLETQTIQLNNSILDPQNLKTSSI